MIIINFILTILFWQACDSALEDGRPGFGFFWLFLSALNGAAILATIF